MTDALRICPLCEATCGLVLTIEGDAVTRVRGDDQDVFSRGFICPKGVALGELHADPRRLRSPLVRDDSGELRESSWEEAFDVIRSRLAPIVAAHGADAVGLYLGNPNVHSLAGTFMLPAFVRALGTMQRFSASTVDQMPKQAASALMFGTPLSVPVPDVDRTDYFLILGANPMVSNGSLMTAADMPGRLRALRKRGGRLVVVDPIRTRTADIADEHLPIRPGSDALWLASLAHELVPEPTFAAAKDWIDLQQWKILAEALADFTPEATASMTGIDAATTRRIAEELRSAEHPVVYGRMGTTTSGLAVDGQIVPMATLASWLIDVVNIAVGALDAPGGAMFPLPVAGGPTTEGTPGRGRGVTIPGRRRTRVRRLPSVLGEFPTSALAEEIDTPDPQSGERIRAVFVIGGNPLVSTPDSHRLTAAFESLDFLVCVDPYLTTTSQVADVVLPVASPLTRPHHDVVFNNLAVRNQARYSPAVFAVPDGEMDEADVLLKLAAIAIGIAAGEEPSSQDVDDLIAFTVAQQACTDEASRAHGREPSDLLGAVSHRRGVERILDLRIRTGPYGDGFGAHPDGLTLDIVMAAPHGIDLGPLQPRLPEVLRTPTGRIEVAPDVLLAALAAASPLLNREAGSGRFALVGRRQLRSNNSWMKGLETLTGGSNVPTAMIHPVDAHELGISEGRDVRVSSVTGSITLPVEIRDEVSPGCVCIPHGWTEANVNSLVDGAAVDQLGGTSVLSGFPVDVALA
jgi:anaerobic selenocysteine-containing dehydrogenase